MKCSNLNSGDAFLVVSAGQASGPFLWLGQGANEPELELGEKLLRTLLWGAQGKTLKEGEETADFWEALGGQSEYSTSKDTGVAAGFEPRLFHCSNAQGYFHVHEVQHFSQDDMLNDDIMLLDAY